MVPGLGSVAPVHSGRDLADYRAPSETCLLCPDFLQSTATEESTHSAVFRGPEGLVEVIERRAGRQGQDHGLEPQSVPQVASHLTGRDEQRQVPRVVPTAQVFHHKVELVAVVRRRVDVGRLYPLGEGGPAVELCEVVRSTRT